MQQICSLTLEDLKERLALIGEKPFRAVQIFDWIHVKGATSFDEMTNLSKDSRAKLTAHFAFPAIKLIKTMESEDGETIKFLWELRDGKKVESVLIMSGDRRTVCVSCQVGCPARCAFCASGKEGLMRNLSPAEIVEQALHINRFLLTRQSNLRQRTLARQSQIEAKRFEGRGHSKTMAGDGESIWQSRSKSFVSNLTGGLIEPKEERVSHIVFMGMGEPLENYDAVVKSIQILHDPNGCNISQRRITVSTVGVVEGIHKLAKEELKVNLVLSLHAPNQNIRKKIIPYARKYPLEEILMAMDGYSRDTKRDITYEYTLLANINDHPAHAEELAELVRGKQCTVNLIPYNPVDGLRLRRPEKEAIEDFRAILENAGINTTWRYTKGKDIAAACGQLALHK